MKVMKIAILGAGYVGLSIAACLSEIGHRVFCFDNNKNKLELLKKGISTIYEPKLDGLLKKNTEKGNLVFCDNSKTALNDCDICFIAVGTPSKDNGEVDTKAVDEAILDVAKYINKYTIIINKSTVPIGSAHAAKEKIAKLTDIEFDVVSNPEFLRQGSAIDDFLNPERVVIGLSSKRAKERMLELYEPLNLSDEKIIFMDENSAEMVKYCANSFLALKISFINEIANLCEKTGANIEEVKRGISKDSRIGDKFLNPGLGFGGSCFPKDISAIINIADECKVELETIKAAKSANEKQRLKFVEKIYSFYNGNLKDKTFALWGLSFKPDTNDLRQAPSITIIKELVKYGAKVKGYDCKAKFDYQNFYQLNSAYMTLDDANALIIANEWEEFKNPDFNLIKNKLKDCVIFDGRNLYIERNLARYGLKYFCVGKNEQQN